MKPLILIFLLIGLSTVSFAKEAPFTDPPVTVGINDTTIYGGLNLGRLLDWHFSYNSPEKITAGLSLNNRIPIILQNFEEIKQSEEWNNYGWFEAEMIVDSTLAGIPFLLRVQDEGASKVWINGRLVLESGNPSPNPDEEKLNRWQNPFLTGVTLREGHNFLLIEYSKHTFPANVVNFYPFEHGFNLVLLPNSERKSRTQRGIVFGGVMMLLFLLILIHSYLGFTFREGYHIFVSLATVFMLIHAFATLSDTMIDWTFAYRYYHDLIYVTAFAFVIYFYLISIRTFYKLDVPWKSLTFGLVIIVSLALYSILNKPELMNIINPFLGISTFIYGSWSLYEAKKRSKENRILSIALGFIVTICGALLYVFVYLVLGFASVALILLATVLAYTALPVSLTFNVAQSYTQLFKTLDDKVKERTAQLEASNQYKTKFLTNISHEFRTPITIIQGMANKAFNPGKNNKDTPKELAVVYRNLNRLNNMVDQIIDLTKSDESEITLNKKVFKADDLVSISVESFRSLAENRDIEFNFFPEGEDAFVLVDREKMEIMVNNLISNAIKFSPDGAQATIKTSCSLGEYFVTVNDTGPGIPAGEEELIFERFHRINRPEEDYVEGMGVGLDLSRILARLHGGDIVAVPGQEKGAMFKLSLPLVETDEMYDVECFETDVNNYGEILTDSILPQNKYGYRILLVEDNLDMADYVSEVISELGEVHRATDGLEALEILKTLSPDIIITDLTMPKMGGQKLVENLATHKTWKNIPVIVLTAKTMEEDKLNLLRIGVVDYITKPFKPEQLLLKTKNLLSFYMQRLKLSMRVTDEERAKIEGLKERVAAFITQHITDTDISVERLALEFSQSRRSFYRNIQIETGMTPAQFIREVRLTVARNLAHGKQKMTLDELTIAVGYKTTAGFKRAYKQRFDEHPHNKFLD